MTTDDLRRAVEAILEAERHATPAPWWNDSGNGEIESRHPDYRRAVVVQRMEHFRWDPYTQTHTDPRYEMCRNAKRIDPESDMEFIVLARNSAPQLARALLAALDVVVAADLVSMSQVTTSPHANKFGRYMVKLNEALAAFDLEVEKL